ncbi:MAG: hypothetical protein JJU46_03950 [Balneolaceae bacterium]|nr:hypothetical protein [Balneolaceae bacterium]MCH8549148.1 hypothetical protein [Balneolaceae bacterium]
MKALKTILTVSTLILFAGCASVTDVNLDQPEEKLDTQIQSSESFDGTWDQRNGDSMDPIIYRPSAQQ